MGASSPANLGLGSFDRLDGEFVMLARGKSLLLFHPM